ncbi:hypothetical protein [Streptomyces sp. NBC_01304]|uniref:hypothetical protein n=1 Tax=Streptomyces sp. NBC_01304 TaxID=2903818 RepID=UPI002E10EF80|nr:hypothetical protein OG430_48725 [Streptomyces sp. NBC_01304]
MPPAATAEQPPISQMTPLPSTPDEPQTPATAPKGTPENVWPLISASEIGRAYVTGPGDRLRIESADEQMTYTLRTVPDDGPPDVQTAFTVRARQLAGEVAQRGKGAPKWRKRPLRMWPGKAPRAKEFAPAGFTPGVMLAWTAGGVRFTGQVWANKVRSGDWNGNRGDCSAVVVATVGGRRARRDEARCLPLVHGARLAQSSAFVVTDGENADVEEIAPQCAEDGLFDVVSTGRDPVEDWESEGGYATRAEEVDYASVQPVPAQPPALAGAPATEAEVTGELCPRCDRHALFGLECAYCGSVIITALVPEPCHPPAWTEGCCPRCLTASPPEVFEVSGRVMCAACASSFSDLSWRARSRRVTIWVDPPDGLAYATAYAVGIKVSP